MTARVTVEGLTKAFGEVRAVDELTFALRSGAVTGFLGPNGAGKTTTLRLALGLIAPDAGRVLIDGTTYRMLVHPARTVGAVLDSARSHPGSTGRDHLRTYAALSGIARPRVDEVIDLVDMGGFADRRTGGFSTGMRQRLHLATALLGDPPILLLDEPGNGLDPAGTAWLHRFLADCAAEGRTVLVSSHVLAELEEVAHDVVLIDQGRLVSAASLPEVRGAHRTLTESFLALTGGTT